MNLDESPKEKVRNGKWNPEPRMGIRGQRALHGKEPRKPVKNQERVGMEEEGRGAWLARI